MPKLTDSFAKAAMPQENRIQLTDSSCPAFICGNQERGEDIRLQETVPIPSKAVTLSLGQYEAFVANQC